MRKIQPAGDTVHVSFVRTQALSVECRCYGSTGECYGSTGDHVNWGRARARK